MKPLLSIQNIRNSDLSSNIPSTDLIFKAAEGIFNNVSFPKNTAIICGTGNNGADGLALSLLLKEAELILIRDNGSVDFDFFLEKVKEKDRSYHLYSSELSFSSYEMIVDCLLGTGYKGKLSPLYQEVIEKINQAEAKVISCDINSGLNGDNGIGKNAVISDLTISLGYLKTGYFLGDGKDKIKDLINVDLGFPIKGDPYRLIEKDDLKKVFVPRSNNSHKGTYGYCALIGGCVLYSGAAKLANMSLSALKAGCGVNKLAVPADLVSSVSPYLLESTLFPLSCDNGHIVFNEEEILRLIANCNSVAVGMGIGDHKEVKKLISYLLENYEGTLIIDADGLNALSILGDDWKKDHKPSLILTPHMGEFSRLCGVDVPDILNDPVYYAKKYAYESNCIVLLKGPSTILTDGTKVYLTDKGCPGMATAGSGDVLSGILCGVTSFSKNDLLLSSSAAAYLNGLAGELAQEKYGAISQTASDTVSFIGKAVQMIMLK